MEIESLLIDLKTYAHANNCYSTTGFSKQTYNSATYLLKNRSEFDDCCRAVIIINLRVRH